MVHLQPPPANLASLPPELLLEILTYTLTTALLSPTKLVNGQFTTLCISGRTCAFRNVAGLLAVCRNLRNLDVDLGFFVDLGNSPSLIPPSLRSLTLRNAEPSDIVSLLERLPFLEDLTLRLALGCFPAAGLDVPSDVLPSLRRFELSTTAFGTTSLSFILSLLSSSHASLKSLTLRNKGATKPTVEAFLPVARGLIERFADGLEELAVKDIPRSGRREAPLDWFPLHPTSFPRLRNLHLTGLAYPSPSFFTQRLILPSPANDASPKSTGLRSLTIEDFDSPSPSPLVEALRTVSALSRLEELRVAFAEEDTAVGADAEAWKEGKKAIEAWCERDKRETGRRTRSVAGWKVVRIEQAGMW